MSIDRQTLVQALLTGEVEITYNKLSDEGREHKIVGTLERTLIEKFLGDPAATETKAPNDAIVHFIVPEKGQWRCVRVDSVIEFNSL